jgi:hypothetical protein
VHKEDEEAEHHDAFDQIEAVFSAETGHPLSTRGPTLRA